MGATKRLAEMYVQALAAQLEDPLHHRALRQRAGQRGQRGADLQGADRPRRPGDGDRTPR